MKTLARVIKEKADPEVEPRRDQRVYFDGREVQMLCCLTRTAVLEVDGVRRVVPLNRVHIRRVDRLRWQPLEGLTSAQQIANNQKYKIKRKADAKATVQQRRWVSA